MQRLKRVSRIWAEKSHLSSFCLSSAVYSTRGSLFFRLTCRRWDMNCPSWTWTIEMFAQLSAMHKLIRWNKIFWTTRLLITSKILATLLSSSLVMTISYGDGLIDFMATCMEVCLLSAHICIEGLCWPMWELTSEIVSFSCENKTTRSFSRICSSLLANLSRPTLIFA